MKHVMDNRQLKNPRPSANLNLAEFPPDVTEMDRAAWDSIVVRELNPKQQHEFTHPEVSYPMQHCVLAVHWHPEFIPLDLIMQRIAAMFPNRKDELIIPLQNKTMESVPSPDYLPVMTTKNELLRRRLKTLTVSSSDKENNLKSGQEKISKLD